MFFFGGDNDLSPLIVPQIKAIKDAGFEQDTEVLVYFDTNERGIPTQIYNVNNKRKGRKGRPQTEIGDGRDPFARVISEDRIEIDSANAPSGSHAAALKKGIENPDSLSAFEALKEFVGFCVENHSAEHYVLVLVGHGMIVANDSFLPDDSPKSAISLKQLADCLKAFPVTGAESSLDLLALHSCSMSSLELSYELKGLARYLLASQGMSFVGSWPYRQLLKKAFNSIDGPKPKTDVPSDNSEQFSLAPSAVLGLLESIFYLCYHNSRDYAAAGYSLDLALTNLNRNAVTGIKEPIQGLVKELNSALETPRGRELVLLAHWESQSYWQEDYTDLFDFCFCLRRMCITDIESSASEEATAMQRGLLTAASRICTYLTPHASRAEKDLETRFARLVVHSANIGFTYQYSHGLSVYFPWSEPLGDVEKSIINNYKNYAFHTEFENDSWFSFLETYFNLTKRRPRAEELPLPKEASEIGAASFNFGLEGVNTFNDLITLEGDPNKPTPAMSDPNKPSPRTGGACECPSIKNYPTVGKHVGVRTIRTQIFSLTLDEITKSETPDQVDLF
jgi:hypothetical protein